VQEYELMWVEDVRAKTRGGQSGMWQGELSGSSRLEQSRRQGAEESRAE